MQDKKQIELADDEIVILDAYRDCTKNVKELLLKTIVSIHDSIGHVTQVDFKQGK